MVSTKTHIFVFNGIEITFVKMSLIISIVFKIGHFGVKMAKIGSFWVFQKVNYNHIKLEKGIN